MLIELDNEHIIRVEFISKIEDNNGTAVITMDDGTTTQTVEGLSVQDVWKKIKASGGHLLNNNVRFP